MAIHTKRDFENYAAGASRLARAIWRIKNPDCFAVKGFIGSLAIVACCRSAWSEIEDSSVQLSCNVAGCCYGSLFNEETQGHSCRPCFPYYNPFYISYLI